MRSDDERLRSAAKALEGVFLSYMFKAMRATVPEGGLFEHSQGEEMFTAMLDERLAEITTATSNGGLGDQLYEQLRQRLVQQSTSGQ
jgi:flagellar protein FlgJ